jgi:hypothetical protein
LYNDNKILFENSIYTRENETWEKHNVTNPYKEIDFISFELYSSEVKKLQEKIYLLQKENDVTYA